MTVKKIRSVVTNLSAELTRQHIPEKRMPANKHFSKNVVRAKREMLAHAHWLLEVSLPELLSDTKRLRSRSGHGKIGRHLASVQVLLWTADMYTLSDLMNQNRKD